MNLLTCLSDSVDPMVKGELDMRMSDHDYISVLFVAKYNLHAILQKSSRLLSGVI